MDAIGTDLVALVHHLYRCKPSAAEAISELTLRSHEKCERADVQMAPTAKEIAYTRWFASMKNRYKILRDQLMTRSEVKEAEEVIAGMYPSGCAVGQLADALQSVTDMLTFRIGAAMFEEVVGQRVAALEAKNIARLNLKELTKEFITSLVIPSLMPPRWWEQQPDPKKREFTKLLAVGLRTDPPSIVIEYIREGSEKKRHRTIYLHEALSPTGPTIPLAKKIAMTHGVLINESDLQKYLLKLQKLTKDGVIESQQKPSPVVVPPTATTSGEGVGSCSTHKQPVVNKADLGLLYRDPEAALANVDLQEADELTVKEFKRKMSEKFDSNAVKPGDAGYEYDRRKEFKATKKSDWDEDEEESDDF